MPFENPQSNSELSSRAPRFRDLPVNDSVIGEVIFRKKRAIWNGKLSRATTKYRMEIVSDPDDPNEPETILIFLKNDTGDEAAFRLDAGQKRLIGDYNEYRLSDSEVSEIKRIAREASEP
jgi:hypothetical protein